MVDSGGQGLMQVVKGAFEALLGKGDRLQADVEIPGAATGCRTRGQGRALRLRRISSLATARNLSSIWRRIYETQRSVSSRHIWSPSATPSWWCPTTSVVKVHVHTNDPGLAIQKALTYGSLSRMKIDNMREEHQERLIQDAEQAGSNSRRQQAEEGRKQRARESRVRLHRRLHGRRTERDFPGNLGADCLIEGGQTMNPSTEDMLNAMDQVNADTIFILPNNKNIILAANQAKALVKDKEIVVIPTKTVPQGITALISFMPDVARRGK